MSKKALPIIFFICSMLFCSIRIFSVTGAQYQQEQIISSVNEVLEKGQSERLSLPEKLEVQSKLIQVEAYAPQRANMIRKEIQQSPQLRSQFITMIEAPKIQNEITQKNLTPREITSKIAIFEAEVQKDIDTNIQNKTVLVEELLTDKEVANKLDAGLCNQGNCSQPFTKKMDQIVLEKSKKMGVNISELLTSPSYQIDEEKIEDHVSRDLDLLYDITLSSENMRDIMTHLSNRIKDIGSSVSGFAQKSMQERLDAKTGYYQVVTTIENWWTKIEQDSDINPTELQLLKEEKDKVSNMLLAYLMDDLYQLFSQFEAEYVSEGEDFPYAHILKIQEAAKSSKEDFLSSKAMYGNITLKKELDTSYAMLFQTLKNAQIEEILNTKGIASLIIDKTGNALPAYKKSVRMIRLRLFGRLERLKTFNQSSLAALLWSIGYYISRVTVKIEKNQKKAMELVTLYFENNFNLLIQYRNMFQSIIPPKSVETEITDIITMVEPALNTETKLKFAKKKYQLQSEEHLTTDW